MEAGGKHLAGAGGSFFCTAAEALLQVTGVRQRAPQVAVTGDAVWEVSVTQGAPVTAASIKCRLALALAREHITLVTGRPLTTAVASLEENKNTAFNKCKGKSRFVIGNVHNSHYKKTYAPIPPRPHC